MTDLKLTAVGIPNSCYVCGKMQHVMWYAKNNDEARSGHGLCAEDAGVKPNITKKVTRKKSTRTAVAEPKTRQEEE